MSEFIKTTEKILHIEIVKFKNNKHSILGYWSIDPTKILYTIHGQPIYPININSQIGGFSDLKKKYYYTVYF